MVEGGWVFVGDRPCDVFPEVVRRKKMEVVD